jgi:outer membrane protein OmpA-like peptidoglycan-associated protein
MNKFLFLIGFLLSLHGVQASEDELVKIKGRVLDVENKRWLQSADIYLYKDKKVVHESKTLENGMFEFQIKSNTEFILEVNLLGYRTIKQPITIGALKNGDSRENFLKIYLEKSGIKIRGRVYETEIGMPISDVKVVLFNNNLKTRKTVYTDENGEYIFKAKQNTSYYLKLDTLIEKNTIIKHNISTVGMSGDNDIMKDFPIKVSLPDMQAFLANAKKQSEKENKEFLAKVEEMNQKIKVNPSLYYQYNPDATINQTKSKPKSSEGEITSDFITNYSDFESSESADVTKDIPKEKKKKGKEKLPEINVIPPLPPPATKSVEEQNFDYVEHSTKVEEIIPQKQVQNFENLTLSTTKPNTNIKKTLTIDDFNKQVSDGVLNPIPIGAGSVKSVQITDEHVTVVKNSNVYYQNGKAYLSKEGIDFVIKMVNKAKADPSKLLMVEIYSDAGEEFTIKDYICRLRSEEIVQYIVNNGLPFERVNVLNIGYKILANECAKGVPCSEEKHQENRRAKFYLMDAKEQSGEEVNE